MKTTNAAGNDDKHSTAARRKPRQARAQKRHDQILDITAELLESVGIDGLTTILIAKELKISVGSLYHYYPNKVAILCALASRWLDEMTYIIAEVDKNIAEHRDITSYVQVYTDKISDMYKRQRGILPLVQAMYAIPEVRQLDEQHDTLMIQYLVNALKHFGCKASKPELERIARLYHETTYICSMTIVEQQGSKASRSQADLNQMLNALLANYF
ncbi:TetR/AcrR family transcriptional regulator [Dasania marina]|uniref:TetR/AcrR family transcriptional regulator n=1 Tax=Dasania marina TaxID=471499 RepID=UPI0030D9971E|tara:strand:- start:38011 stop:38655 length:645 start_codon:yes stop_codon:yes gene_type:complete